MTLALRRGLALLTISLVTLAVSMVPAVASPSDESQFVSLINQTRAAAGLSPLSSYGDLVDDARRHTADMIAEGSIFHSSQSQLASATTGWSQLGENVGMGPNPSVLHSAFMSSPSHKANILGDYDRVGVGADRADDGTMFVTVIFMQTAGAPATTTTTAPPTTAPPTTAPTGSSATPGTAPSSGPAPVASPAGGPELIELVETPVDGVSDPGWVELEALAGAYCVTVRVNGSICVE